MSAMYYRVEHPREPTATYGFKKVNQSELVGIVQRLAKPTYNVRVHSEEPEKAHNYRHVHSAPPPHTPSYCARRLSTGSQSKKLDRNRKFTEHELERVLRRLQRPTRSRQLARRDNESGDRHFITSRPSTAASRPVTASERKKALDQLSRPTTASRAKHATECHLCDENDRELNKTLVPFEYPYADVKSVTVEEADNIFSRVSSPTKASEKGYSVCYKTPPNYESLHVQSEHLPLVSGLARSKSVTQIVNRLYYSHGNRRRRNFHGYSTEATQITDFSAMA